MIAEIERLRTVMAVIVFVGEYEKGANHNFKVTTGGEEEGEGNEHGCSEGVRMLYKSSLGRKLR